MEDSTRRRFLRTGGVVGIVGLTGCGQITGGNDVKDTDGDGVIDSEDYAPRDASVQDAEDVGESDSSEQDDENRDQSSEQDDENRDQSSDQDDENRDQSSDEEQSNALKESFENYPTGTLPTNWSITQGDQAGTEVVAESDVQPDAVAGTQMLAVSWNDNSGDDDVVSGWPTDSQESYKPSRISFYIYDKVEEPTNAWHFAANSPDVANGHVLYIIGGNRERRFRFGTSNQKLVTIRDTYWSQGWHKVEFLNIYWQNNTDLGTTDIAIDGNTVQEGLYFAGSKITNIEFRARDSNRQDLLIDDIEITLGER